MNGTRTRDLNLGKVALYQLSYHRMEALSRVELLSTVLQTVPYPLGHRAKRCDEGSRTPNPLVNGQVLCQLSYVAMVGRSLRTRRLLTCLP